MTFFGTLAYGRTRRGSSDPVALVQALVSQRKNDLSTAV